MNDVNGILIKLFRAHGVEAILQDEWVTFPGRGMRANASIYEMPGAHPVKSIQLDVRLESSSGRALIESFAGLGASREEAEE